MSDIQKQPQDATAEEDKTPADTPQKTRPFSWFFFLVNYWFAIGAIVLLSGHFDEQTNLFFFQIPVNAVKKVENENDQE